MEFESTSFDFVHVRVKQSRGRKMITTIENLQKNLDVEKILTSMRKRFCCNGTIFKDEDIIIQLQGDQRKLVFDFLKDEGICDSRQIKIHGF